jgi:hypothetical protein
VVSDGGPCGPAVAASLASAGSSEPATELQYRARTPRGGTGDATRLPRPRHLASDGELRSLRMRDVRGMDAGAVAPRDEHPCKDAILAGDSALNSVLFGRQPDYRNLRL